MFFRKPSTQRTREAVSAFVFQIGFSTASTSSVAMVSTGLARNVCPLNELMMADGNGRTGPLHDIIND